MVNAMRPHGLNGVDAGSSIHVGILDELHTPQCGDTSCFQPMVFGAGNDGRDVPIERTQYVVQRGANTAARRKDVSLDGETVLAPLARACSLVPIQLLSFGQTNLETDAGHSGIRGDNQVRFS